MSQQVSGASKPFMCPFPILRLAFGRPIIESIKDWTINRPAHSFGVHAVIVGVGSIAC